MEFGPFPPRELDDIKKILEKRGISFKISMNPEMLEQQERAFQENFIKQTTYRSETYNPSFCFVEINDADLKRLGNHLEKYGILPMQLPTELEGDDYHCLYCNFISSEATFCPQGHGALVSSAVLNRRKSVRHKNFVRVVSFLALLFLLTWTIIRFFMENHSFLKIF